MAGFPLAKDMKREGREIAALIHVEQEQVHDPVEWGAQDRCKHCRRYLAGRDHDCNASGLYDFERPAGFRVEADASPTVQNLARRIEDIGKTDGQVCGCHPDLQPFGGPGSKLPSAFAVAARGGRMKRDPLSEHKSERRGAGGTPGRNGARCTVYRWVEAT